MSFVRFNPFPGLRAFETHQKHLFFGREVPTAEMLQRLGSTRFLAALGPSGSGKSSLVRAGLIPELLGGANTRAGSQWVVLVFRPGGDPVAALATSLAESELYPGLLDDAPSHLTATLNRGARGLIEAVRQARSPIGTNVLVVVDQFEELFRFAGARPAHSDAADAFVNLLLEAGHEAAAGIYVVLTMRSDFIGDCARFLGLAEAINQGQYLIPRLTRDQWRSAIEGPVRVGGGALAPRLVQRLLNDVADDPDQLPVLQHALMRTWDYWARTTSETVADTSPLDLPHYEAVGGMAEALSRHAEEALADLPDDQHRQVAERLFKALTEKGPDGRGIRRPARFDLLLAATGASEAELKRVADVFRQPGRTFVLPGADVELTSATVLDISHESLMRVWKRLRGWVDDEAQSAGTYRRLAETAALWKQGGAGYYRDPELALALKWRSDNRPGEGWGRMQRGDFVLALRFLDESEAAALRESDEKEAAQRRELEQARARAAEQARRARLFGAVAVVMAGFVIALILAAVTLRRLQREAVSREQEAVSRELAAHAVNQLEVDPELSVLLATEAMRVKTNLIAEEVLRQSLFASQVRFRLGKIGDPPVRIAEFSPNGNRIITAGESTNAGLWDAQTGRSVAVLTGHSAGLTSARFSPRGLAVTASDDGTARIWNAIDGQLIQVLATDANSIRSAEFSPDGTQIVTASEDGTSRVWSGTGWTNRVVLPGRGGKGRGAVFSPSGEQVVTFGDRGSLQLWTLRPAPVGRVRADVGAEDVALISDDIVSAVFSPDGTRFATLNLSTDIVVLGSPARLDSIDLWGLPAFEPAGRLGSQPTDIAGLAASHGHRQWLLVAGNEAQIWDLSERKLITAFVGHTANLLSADFSPGDDVAVTAAGDKTARIWRTDNGRELQVLRGHEAQVNSARFSPDGTWVVTASGDGTARVWQVTVGKSALLAGSELRQLTFNENGREATSLGADGDVLRWPTTAPGQPTSIATNMERFAASDDGTTVALFNGQGHVWRWTPDSKEPIALGQRPSPTADPAVNHDGSLLLWAAANGPPEFWQLKPSPESIAVRDSNWVSKVASFGTATFSPEGRWLATVNSSTNVMVWRLVREAGSGSSTQPVYYRTISGMKEVKSLLFSPGGHLLVTINWAGLAQGWPVERPDESSPDWELVHEAGINHATFDPDGRFLITASSDRATRIWSTATGRLIATLWGWPEEIVGRQLSLLGATFLPESGRVMTVGRDGMVRPFAAEACGPAGGLLDLAQRRLTRALTDQERKRYLPDSSTPFR